MKKVMLLTLLATISSHSIAGKVEKCKRDIDCRAISSVILAESRGESEKGQISVGYVVKNRTKHPDFPNTARKVAIEKGQFHLKTKKLTQEEKEKALETAYNVKNGLVVDPTKGSTHFHKVGKKSPSWAKSKGMKKTVKIDKHVFYKSKESK